MPLVFPTVRSRREDREFQRYLTPEEYRRTGRARSSGPWKIVDKKLLKKFQWHLFTSPEGLLSESDWKDAEDRMKWARVRHKRGTITFEEYKEFLNGLVVDLLIKVRQYERGRMAQMLDPILFVKDMQAQALPAPPLPSRQAVRNAVVERQPQPHVLGFTSKQAGVLPMP
jgi:hypothetical protein